MTTRPISDYLAPALLALGASFAAGSWYLRPEGAVAWAAATATLFVFAVVWGCVTIVLRRSTNEARRRAADSIGSAIVFASLIMVVSLGVKLAVRLGAIDDPDLARRMSNVVAGAVLAFMGNALPKVLTPLSVLQCDGARVQAFQRFSGWTWVLTGLTYAVAWLVLPLGLAKPVSLLLLMSAMLIIVTGVVRLRWKRHREA